MIAIENHDGWILSPGAIVEGTVVGQLLDPESPEGKEALRIRSNGLCHNCGERPGKNAWGDALSITHGGGVPRCDTCTYEAQLEHALERAKEIPTLALLLAKARLNNE